MTRRLGCPPAPGPLEGFAARFDGLFGTLAQRRGFRAHLQGLLSPRERNKTLTALAGAEPVVGAQHADVQRLQFFLSEAPWDAEAADARRLELLLAEPATAPHDGGVLVVDDTGDREDGRATAHVAPQYLGSRGKIENGIVAVSSLWADERVYYPLHVRPYEPAGRLPGGKADPAFRTKPQLAVELVDAALDAGVPVRAVVADCTYGENPTFEGALWGAGLPFVFGLRPSTGTWAPVEDAHTPEEAARRLRWGGPAEPGEWTRVERRFRGGHTETWWAADLTLGGYGPDRSARLVVATADPTALPPLSTRYLTTNLPRPGSPQAAEAPFAPADLAEVVRLYALRNWVEQGYKQAKHELGWANFQVRADRAIRRRWALVCCAFSFCWRAWFAAPPAPPAREKRHAASRRSRRLPLLAADAAAGPRLAGPVASSRALLARLVEPAPARRAPGAARRRRGRPAAPPVPPCLTKVPLRAPLLNVANPLRRRASAMPVRVMHIAEVGLRVKALPRMVTFCREVLGLEVVSLDQTMAFLKVGELPSALGAVGHPQMLVLFDRGVEPDMALTTLDHLAFEIPSDRYPAERERLQAMGLLARERSWPDGLAWPARSLFVHDPEGNVIELIAHDPTAE